MIGHRMTQKNEMPKNLEVEQKVLSAMLMNPDVRIECLARVSPDDFFRPAYRTIFEAMRDMDERGLQVDSVCLIDELRLKGQLERIGGEATVLELNDYLSVPSAPQHLDILLRESARRKVLGAVNAITAVVAEPPSETSDFIAKVQDIFLKSTEQVVPDDLKKMPALMAELDEAIEAARKGRTGGIELGYKWLDQLTCGLQPGQLVVVAARPSIGKTALALNFAFNTAMQGVKTCLFSLEMSSKDIAERFASMATPISIPSLRHGIPDDVQRMAYEKARDNLRTLPIDTDDSTAITVSAMRAKARRSLRGYERGIVIVDYLQLIQSPKSRRYDNRNNEIGEISRGLKVLAKELKVPVIALSQMNRAVENRADRKPMLSDLRESGSIEQDADIVMFLDRSRDEKEAERDNRPDKNCANVIVAKNRQGATGEVTLAFNSETMRYYTFTDNHGNVI